MRQVVLTSWRLPLSKSIISPVSAFESSVSPWHQSSARTVSLSLLQRPVVEHCGRRNYKVPSVENPELTDVLSFKPGAGQNTAKHALPTARNLFLVLVSTFPSIHLHIFPQSSPYLFRGPAGILLIVTSNLKKLQW